MGQCLECEGFGYYRVKFGRVVLPGKPCRSCSNKSLVWTFTHEVHKRWYMWDCVALTKTDLYSRLNLAYGCSQADADNAGLVPIKTSFAKMPKRFVKIPMQGKHLVTRVG